MSGLLYCNANGALLINASGAPSLGESDALLTYGGLPFDNFYFANGGEVADGANRPAGTVASSTITFNKICRDYTITMTTDLGFTPDHVLLTALPSNAVILDTGCDPTTPAGTKILSGVLPECSTGIKATVTYNCANIGPGFGSSVDSIYLAAV